MKQFKIITIIIVVNLLLNASVFAQAPQKMSYQAVIRNSSNALITSAPVGMKISVLQGSATGAVVYAETQTANTNANGLVSIEIGGGAGFSAIDWANNIYFIKTEIDPAGGKNFTITSTSQLLSVPYALHAKTAETVTGVITETDPTFKSSQAINITAADITKLNNLSGVNSGDQDLSGLATKTSVTTGLSGKVDKVTGKGLSTEDYSTAEKAKVAGIEAGAQVNVKPNWNAASGNAAEILNKPTIPTAADGSETKVKAGTNVTITGVGTVARPYIVNATGAATLTIGLSYQGGIIFWLDATGQHGLIAATANQSTLGTNWYNTNTTTNAVRDGVGAGMYNTERIIANQGTGSYAAQLCANYQGGGYGDWYLPSKYELNLLYLQQTVVGGFAGEPYWSSNESDNSYAWAQLFDNGTKYDEGKYSLLRVRAIRAF